VVGKKQDWTGIGREAVSGNKGGGGRDSFVAGKKKKRHHGKANSQPSNRGPGVAENRTQKRKPVGTKCEPRGGGGGGGWTTPAAVKGGNCATTKLMVGKQPLQNPRPIRRGGSTEPGGWEYVPN